jgi:hypothetical protein
MTGREGQDLYRPLLEHIEREGRVAGIGALHAMDAAVGGRQRGDRRRQRVGTTPAAGGRSRRRRRGYGPRPVTPAVPVAGNGVAAPEGGAPPTENGAAPPRKFRRRRGRRRSSLAATNGTVGSEKPSTAQTDGRTPSSGSSPAPQREPATQAVESGG